MKPTTYINWDGLKDIPFFYCDTKEDEENKDFDIYYQGKLVLHDYNHCGHYLYTAALLFSKIRNITADWVNLHNLWILRDCVRENYNHGIGVDDLIFGENFDGKNLDTLTPLTKKRFDYLCKRIKELDPYATILRDCINNDRPAVVFQGDDFCAPEILEAAKEIYRKHGCSEEFLFDWQLLINEVKAYQLESPATVKLPKLSPTETELVREEMTKR